MAIVLLSERARKQLKPLPLNAKGKILKAVERLERWPNVPHIAPLQGRDGFRMRAGEYRLLFIVEQSTKTTITITDIKPRGSAYDP